MRIVKVNYEVPVPGLDVSVPMTDRVQLWEGETDESDIPSILAVLLWSSNEYADRIKVKSVQPELHKLVRFPTVPSEDVLSLRRTVGKSIRGDWKFLSDNNLPDLADSLAVQAGADSPAFRSAVSQSPTYVPPMH